VASGAPASRAIPSLARNGCGPHPAVGQGRGRVPGPAVGREDQPVPGDGLEGVGQGDDLARAGRPAPGHGRDEAVVDPVDQEPAQLRPDPGVAAEQVGQPGHQQRPDLGRLQPRRPPDRPAQEEVALVVGLGGRVEVDRGQPARAGADPVDPRPAGQQPGQLVPPGRHPGQGRRVQGQPFAAPGHGLDRLPGQVAVAGEGDHRRPGTNVGPLWLGEEVDMVAPAGVCLDR
jgi:hypothetical protein